MKRYDINEFRAKDWYRLGEESQGVRKQIKYFKNAVALDPLHGPAWHYLGVLYSRKGDKKMERFCNEKALEAYKTGLQRYKRELTRQEWKNRNESKKDDPMNTVALPKPTYDIIYVIDEEIDDLLENLGRLYCNINELEKAVERYDKLIELYPNWAKPHKTRGGIYYILGNHPKAIDDLRFAIEVDGEDYKSLFFLGKSYSKIGNSDRADWYFAKAKHIAKKLPNNIEAKEIMADSSFELEEYDDSIEGYKDVLEKFPHNRFVWNKLADAHLAKGRNKSAKRCFEKACKIFEQEKSKTDGGRQQ